MTDRPAKRPRRPSFGAVVQASFAAFALVLALLVLQLRAGRDPALGPGRAAAPAPATASRRVLVRRVVVTRVVVRQIEDPGEGGGPAQVATRTVLVPRATTAAPAPAPVAAPAPAPPAPAPLVTKTS